MSRAAFRRTALLASWGWLAGCASSPVIESVMMMPAEEAAEPQGTTVADSTAAPMPRVAPLDSAGALGQVLLLLPFRNSSDYKGPWDIHKGLPRTLADSLALNEFFHVVPVDSALAHLQPDELEGEIGISRAADLGALLGADWVVLGDIEELTMKRFQATVPLGGYRSYEGLVGARLSLVNAVDGRRGGEVSAEGLVDSKRTGITNPAAFVPLDKQYFFFDDLEWGSDQFRESLIGKALALWAHHAAAGVGQQIRPPPAPKETRPQVIDIDGSVAYINIGVADGVRNGDKFGVWDDGRQLRDPDTGEILGRALPRRVGVIQVERVLNDHLAQARVLDGADRIEAFHAVRAE